MRKKQIHSGKVLIAEPFMVDPHFKRSVVLICEHTKEGSLGFILNKSLDMKINELIADFPEFDAPVFYGGPVQTDTIHYVHSLGDLLDDCQKVSKGIYWGGDFENLKFLISSKLVEPNQIRFFVGYSGWTELQLEEEMNYGSWVLGDMDPNFLYKNQPNSLWQDVMEFKGDAYSVIAQMPEGVNWN